MEINIIKKKEKNNFLEHQKLRVAAYVRVSTERELQIQSYESQIKYYTDKINKNTNWELVKIYSDLGISGTNTNKRTEFIKMIEDAIEGKIDLIFTKSISRFARNTADTLKYVRMLKEREIPVIFEEEHLNTMHLQSELILSVLSSVAEQESKNISEHTKLGIRMAMQQGILIGKKCCLGYTFNKEKQQYFIDEKNAKTIRLIYKLFLEGKTRNYIIKTLKDNNIKNINNNTNWSSIAINSILSDVKYIGDILQLKVYKDKKTNKRVKNKGEENFYYIKDHHEAIISREDFTKVQEMLDKTIIHEEKYKKSMNRTFDQDIICGICGNKVYLVEIKYKDKSNKYWVCSDSSGKRTSEDSIYIKETLILEAFEKCLKKIKNNFDYNNLEIIKEYKEINNKLKNKIKEIKCIQNKESKLIDLNINKLMSEYIFNEKINILNNQINQKREEVEEIEKRKKESEDIKKIIDILNEKLNKIKNDIDFKENIFNYLVKYIIIGKKAKNNRKNPYSIRFIFNDSYSREVPHFMRKESKKIIEKQNELFIPILDFKIHEKKVAKKRKKDGTLERKVYNYLSVSFEIEKYNGRNNEWK